MATMGDIKVKWDMTDMRELCRVLCTDCLCSNHAVDGFTCELKRIQLSNDGKCIYRTTGGKA